MRLLSCLGLILVLSCSDSTTATSPNSIFIQLDGVSMSFKSVNRFGYFDTDNSWTNSYEGEDRSGNTISLHYRGIPDAGKLISVIYKLGVANTEFRSDDQLVSDVIGEDGELSSGNFSGVLTNYSGGSKHISGSFKFAFE